VANETGQHEVAFDKHVFYKGRVYGEYNSDVRAHFLDGHFKASILLHNETFYLQPRHLHPEVASPHSHVIFPGSAVVGNTQGTTCGVDHGDTHDGEGGDDHDHGHEDLAALQQHISAAAGRYSRQRRGFQGDPTKTTCEMALVSDHLFFADRGQSSFSTTATV
jgi:hypothetical protein